MSSDKSIAGSYNGTNATFRLLRDSSWGPELMNLGFFSLRGLFSPINLVANLAGTQHALARKSIKLLNVQPGDNVLDVACGRGKSSYLIKRIHPDAIVTGVDLLPENIQIANTLYGNVAGLSYCVGDAQRLEFTPDSFGGVMCLEAAFHFPQRERFLEAAARVLRSNGRLVVVDFVWKSTDARRCRDDELTRVVRDIWQWDDLFTRAEYESIAASAGLITEAFQDWSYGVTRPLQSMFDSLAWLGRRQWGRNLITTVNPLLGSMTDEDWREIDQSAKAHRHLGKLAQYVAFVFRKSH